MRLALIMLLISTVAMAGDDRFFTTTVSDPTAELLQQLDYLMLIIVPMMMAMLVLAAVVYIVGQMFGAETRAKATVWAHGMLAAVGVSALVVVMLYFFLPEFMVGGTVPLSLGDPVIQAKLESLSTLAQNALVLLIIFFIVLSALVFMLGQMADVQTRSKASVYATGLLSGAVVASVLYIIIFEIFGRFRREGFGGQEILGGPYTEIVMIIAFFTAVVVLITYLLSRFFKVPEWEAYLNIELSNIASSFLLVLFIIGLFAVGDVVAGAFSEGAHTPPQAAINYMRGTVANSVLLGIYDTYHIQACTSILSTITRRIGEFVLTQTYKVFPGTDTFVSITNVIGFGLVSIYGSISAQIALLYFVDATMRNFFLPAGLILRFFPPTRDAGAFLISLAFGMQIIFPTTYMINKTIYEDIGAEPYRSNWEMIYSLCGPLKYGLAGILINPGTNPIFGLIPGGAAIGTLMMRLVSETALNLASMAEFIPIMRSISALSLLAIFIPALSMLLTIAFINSMTKFIVAKV
jgi:hypothetical protein